MKKKSLFCTNQKADVALNSFILGLTGFNPCNNSRYSCLLIFTASLGVLGQDKDPFSNLL